MKCLLCDHDPNTKIDTSVLKETYLLAYIISKLNTPITESKAYKIGLITETGNIIKNPETTDEKNCFSVIERYILNVKKLLGNKIDLLNNSLYLEKINKLPTTSDNYEAELNLRKELKISVKRFKEALDYATMKHLSTALVEKMILEEFKEM